MKFRSYPRSCKLCITSLFIKSLFKLNGKTNKLLEQARRPAYINLIGNFRRKSEKR